jgi:hypothetical protein
MNAEQVAAVLAKIQLGDNRLTDSAGLVLAEWVDSIGDLDFDDAVEAVRMHRQESTVYLQPAHVRANVRRVRDLRARELRRSRPALEPARVTLDRVEFDRITQEAIDAGRVS